MDDAETSFSETNPLLGHAKHDHNKHYNGQNNEGLWNLTSKTQQEPSPQSKTTTATTTTTTTTHGNKGDNVPFSAMAKTRKVILALSTVSMFLTSWAASLQGAFYVIEAQSKQVSVLMIGIVFGVFHITVFLFCPIFGNYMSKIGVKFCYIASFLVGGCCNILFGTLNKAPSGSPFIVTSIAVRFVEAICFSCFFTASYAIALSEFPKNIGFIFGTFETAIGLGYTLGPVIGAGLYEMGGYSLPFVVVGVAVLFNGFLMYLFIPVPSIPVRPNGSMFTLFRSPLVLVGLFSVFIIAFCQVAFDATFVEHLTSFDLSPSITSLFYSIPSAVHTIMATFWGCLTDKKENILCPLLCFGHLIFCVGYLFLGPSPLLPFIPFSLWSLAMGTIFLGFSLGCILIPGIKLMFKGAGELGFEDNVDTYALVSGIFNSVYSLGGFVGPIVVGGLIEPYGYPIAYSTAGIVQLFGILVAGVVFSIRYSRAKREEDKVWSYAKIKETLEWVEEDMYHLRSDRSFSIY